MSDKRAILLVEDNEDDIALLQRAFTKAALLNPLHIVRDGEQAIAYLQGTGKYANRESHPAPDLLLLDLKMPRKDGFQVLQWIRSQPGLNRLRIVVLTTSLELRDINRAYQMGANSYLVKPYDFQQLVTMVRMLRDYWISAAQAPELTASEQRESTAQEPRQ